MGRFVAAAVLALVATPENAAAERKYPVQPVRGSRARNGKRSGVQPRRRDDICRPLLKAVEKSEGRAPVDGAPEIALYESRGRGSEWSQPLLLPFSGKHKDYEASLSPDGLTMIFNSWRPLPDGTAVTNQKNNLWMVRRAGEEWGQPVYLTAINGLETEESYAAQTADGRLFYVQEGAADANGPDWSIHTTRIVGDSVDASTPSRRRQRRSAKAIRGSRPTGAT